MIKTTNQTTTTASTKTMTTMISTTTDDDDDEDGDDDSHDDVRNVNNLVARCLRSQRQRTVMYESLNESSLSTTTNCVFALNDNEQLSTTSLQWVL